MSDIDSLPSRIESLQHQIAELEQNLRLIEERKAEFVLPVDLRLQLIKEEERQRSELTSKQAELNRLLGVSSSNKPLEAPGQMLSTPRPNRSTAPAASDEAQSSIAPLSPMNPQAALAPLRLLLAALYGNPDFIRVVATDVGLPIEHIDWSGASAKVWYNVLIEAHRQQRVAPLVDLICAQYPTQATTLRAALAQYTAAIAPSLDRSFQSSTNEWQSLGSPQEKQALEIANPAPTSQAKIAAALLQWMHLSLKWVYKIPMLIWLAIISLAVAMITTKIMQPSFTPPTPSVIPTSISTPVTPATFVSLAEVTPTATLTRSATPPSTKIATAIPIANPSPTATNTAIPTVTPTSTALNTPTPPPTATPLCNPTSDQACLLVSNQQWNGRHIVIDHIFAPQASWLVIYQGIDYHPKDAYLAKIKLSPGYNNNVEIAILQDDKTQDLLHKIEQELNASPDAQVHLLAILFHNEPDQRKFEPDPSGSDTIWVVNQKKVQQLFYISHNPIHQ